MKKVIKSFVFLAIGIWMLGVCSQVIGAPSEQGNKERFQEFYSLPENSLDYLVIGASHAYRNVNPMQIYAWSGYKGFVLGSPNQSIAMTYYWLQESLKYQSPKVIFIDVASLAGESMGIHENDRLLGLLPMRTSITKIKASIDCSTSNEMLYSIFFPLYRFHSRWTELSRGDFSHVSENVMKGAYISFKKQNYNMKEAIDIFQKDTYVVEDGAFQKSSYSYNVGEEKKVYFNKIVNLCKEKGIEIVPTYFSTLDWDNEREQAVEELLHKYDLHGINPCSEYDVKLEWSVDTFDDGYHLNYWGATKESYFVTSVLEQLMVDKNENTNLLWDSDLINYCLWEQNQLSNNRIKTINYLQTLMKNKREYITVFSVMDEAVMNWNPTLERLFNGIGLNGNIYIQGQNSYIGIVDSGAVLFDRWADQALKLITDINCLDGSTHSLQIESAGWAYGISSSIKVDGQEYSMRKRGFNIVVIDKRTGQVISSVAIDTHSSGLTFYEMQLPEAESLKWKELAANTQCVENGIYNIVPVRNEKCALDVPFGVADNNTNIQLCDKNDLEPQKFEFNYIGDGLYTIRAICSNKYLSIENMGNTAGSNVVQQEYSGLANQKWFITENENGSYSIISLYNKLVLDVYGGVAESGTNIQVWTENFQPAQQFYLISTQ